MIVPIYCAAYRLKRYMLILGNTSGKACERLADIKQELEENEALARDFPHLCGRGRLWHKDENITRNGVKIHAFGTDGKVRGAKWGHIRPDAAFFDDCENDDHVRNKEQRDKVEAWLLRAVLKTKGVGKKFDAWFYGTVLHLDSVLARLLDPSKFPGWSRMKYRAVIRSADRQDLWKEWEALYTDYDGTQDDDLRKQRAHDFYVENQTEMLRGVEVLWAAGEPYEQLMRLKIDEGSASFASEKQNDPIDASNRFFPRVGACDVSQATSVRETLQGALRWVGLEYILGSAHGVGNYRLRTEQTVLGGLV